MVVEADVPMDVSQAARDQTPELASHDAVKVSAVIVGWRSGQHSNKLRCSECHQICF